VEARDALVQSEVGEGECGRFGTAEARLRGCCGRVSRLISPQLLVINAQSRARSVPLPTIHQLADVFDELPDEPEGPAKKLGPQYERKPPNRNRPNADQRPRSLLERLGWSRPAPEVRQSGNPMGALRNGDRALVVAVNDSGNTGWVRFGRTGFAGAAVM